MSKSHLLIFNQTELDLVRLYMITFDLLVFQFGVPHVVFHECGQKKNIYFNNISIYCAFVDFGTFARTTTETP